MEQLDDFEEFFSILEKGRIEKLKQDEKLLDETVVAFESNQDYTLEQLGFINEYCFTHPHTEVEDIKKQIQTERKTLEGKV